MRSSRGRAGSGGLNETKTEPKPGTAVDVVPPRAGEPASGHGAAGAGRQPGEAAVWALGWADAGGSCGRCSGRSSRRYGSGRVGGKGGAVTRRARTGGRALLYAQGAGFRAGSGAAPRRVGASGPWRRCRMRPEVAGVPGWLTRLVGYVLLK